MRYGTKHSVYQCIVKYKGPLNIQYINYDKKNDLFLYLKALSY